ncbi:MAG: hypothetical protein QOI28_3360, partial [Mycobacterium sp.]|nr:hypothetical protein [Mycobacterium sp.]
VIIATRMVKTVVVHGSHRTQLS